MNKYISRLQFVTQTIDGFSHIEQIQKALDGGCDWVQLRIKDASREEIIKIAIEARKLTRNAGAVLIINDSPEVAKAVDADGVHLGKNDCSPMEALKFLGDKFIIGATANTMDDIEQAIDQSVDYFGIGPFKFTTTKKNLSPVLGLDGYKNIVQQCLERGIDKPMVAIGSVSLDDVSSFFKIGMYGVAVSSAISKSKNPSLATEKLLQAVNSPKLFALCPKKTNRNNSKTALQSE